MPNDPEENEPDAASEGWDSSSAEEIAAAIAPPKEEEEKPTSEEAAKPEAGKTADTPEEAVAEAEAEGKAGDAPSGWVDPSSGVEYTNDELREYIRGGLRESDYTRKMQKLADERRALDEDRRRLLSEATTPARQAPAGDDTDLEDPEIPDSVRNILKSERAERRSLQEQLQRREQEADRRAFEERTWSTFEQTLESLYEKEKVTDPWARRQIRLAVLDEDPDFEDFEDLKSAVERSFGQAHRELKAKIREAAGRQVDALKAAPRGLPSPKGGTSVSPKPQPKKESSGFTIETSPDEILEELEAIRAGK